MPMIENVRREVRMRSESNRLREQQDREYQESVEADRRNRECLCFAFQTIYWS